MNQIDLRSDTVTKPSAGMRRAMAEAEVGDDVFSDDPTVIRLEKTMAEMLGKEASLLLPSGTMSNQAAIATLTEPGQEMYCERQNHTFQYESAGPAVISSVQVQPIDGTDGVITAAQIRPLLRDYDDLHMPRSRLITIENTHNRAGGRLFPLAEMKAIRELADEKNLFVHLDGARLFNASTASGISASEYASLADTVNICLSKALGAPVGSMLSGTKDVIAQARRWRKRLGGGMRQAGILAAAGLYALKNNIERLAEDHTNAKRLAQGLGELPGLFVSAEKTESNIVLILVDQKRKSVQEIIAALKEKDILVVPFGEGRIRAVTHLDVSADEIEKTIVAFTQMVGSA